MSVKNYRVIRFRFFVQRIEFGVVVNLLSEKYICFIEVEEEQKVLF